MDPRSSSQAHRSAIPNADKRTSTATSADSIAASAANRAHVEEAPPRGLTVTPASLRVVAPVDVQVGDVFDARIDADAGSGMQELLFAIKYDKRRLLLVGWSEGTFARAGAFSPEIGVQEPSDGNVEVRFRLGNGHFNSGTGSIVVLQFEAIKTGVSPIRLTNVLVTDRPGATRRDSDVEAQGNVVTIH